MLRSGWIDGIAYDAAKAFGAKMPRGQGGSGRGGTNAASRGVEELERRVLLSSAIAAFAAQQTFATGADPRDVTFADVNRDGKPDLLVANFADNDVGVLLGNGDGSFSAEGIFGTGPHPYSLAVADVNGDGKPDVLVANYGGASISVLLGNGDGTFREPVNFAAGNGPYTVLTADFNGDGKLDAAVSDYADGTVSILLGNGNGTFSAPAAQGVGVKPSGLAVGDINGDGKPDLAVTNFGDSTISVVSGNGNGTFQPQVVLPAGSYPNSVAIADINSDGKPDLAVADAATAGAVNLFLANGNGTFLRKTFGTATKPISIAAADINRDGKIDLTLSSFGLNDAAVFLGNGDGTFQPQKLFSVAFPPNSAYPGTVAIADVNTDGRLDLVLSDSGVNAVSVLIGDVPPTVLSINRADPTTQTTLSAILTYTVTFNEPVTGVDPSDFAVQKYENATGYTSISDPLTVSGSGSQYAVTVSGRSGEGSFLLKLVDNGSIKDMAGNPLQRGGARDFTGAADFTGGTIDSAGLNVAVDDVNRDGNPDIVLTGHNGIRVRLGNGDGTFAYHQQTFANSDIWAESIADMNSDGKPDVVFGELSGQVGVMLGNGDGTFQAPVTFAGGTFLVSVSTVDINGDGKTDVVFCDYLSNTVGVMLGNGDGSLSPPVTYSSGLGPDWVTTADLNGDGIPDVVVSNRNSSSLGELLGNGDGTLAPAVTIDGGFSPNSVYVADCNNDGKLDLFVGDEGGNRPVSLLLGNGNGTFKPAMTITHGLPDGSPALPADVNGDGKIDLVVQNGAGGPLIFSGNGDGTFGPSQDYLFGGPSGGSFPSLIVADLNHDGRADIIDDGATTAVLLATGNSNFVGQNYIVPLSNSVSVSSGDQVTLRESSDQREIDWGTSSVGSAVAINDANGLTINGSGGNVTIVLDHTNGNPLPNNLHLNGNFTITGLQGDNPFASTRIDIGQSTVYFAYTPGSDPLAAIQQALQTGYNTGAWNGVPTASTGAITSSSAALNPATYAIGYADSADGTGVNTTPNSIEIKYTLNGDANLNGATDIFDLNLLLPHFNGAGSWTSGDFTYNGQVDVFDLNALLPNFNHTLPPAFSSGVSTTALMAQISTAAAMNSSSAPNDSQTATPATPSPFIPDDALHHQNPPSTR